MVEERDSFSLRMKVAISCRILGMLGLMRESTGHVSARIPGTDEMWIRCRGGHELGLMFTGLHNIRRTDFDGNGPGVGPDHIKPNEVHIHGEIYRAHPNVQCVVHAHPYYALMCGVTNMTYRPIFGAYEPSTVDMMLRGIPVFPRSALISNKQIAKQMLDCLGNRDVLLMKGHGITCTAASVETATVQAIRFDRVSKIMWDVALSGREAPEIAAEDLEQYRKKVKESPVKRDWAGGGVPMNWEWHHYVRLLDKENVGLPTDYDLS